MERCLLASSKGFSVFKNVEIYVADITELVLMQQSLTQPARTQSISYRFGASPVFHLVSACFSDLSSAFCIVKFKEEPVHIKQGRAK